MINIFSFFQPLPLTYEAYLETTKQNLLQEFLSRINSKQLEKPCPRPDSRGQLEINVKTRPTRPPFTLRSLLNEYARLTVLRQPTKARPRTSEQVFRVPWLDSFDFLECFFFIKKIQCVGFVVFYTIKPNIVKIEKIGKFFNFQRWFQSLF